MRNYEFKLTPAYCLYNGIAVVKQEGSHICFMAENPADTVLRNRLKKAFSNYVDYVLRQEDCPSEYRDTPSVVFVQGSRTELRNYVSKLYSMPEKQISETKTENPQSDAAAVLLLDSILAEARSCNATDIHIESNMVRFRINGILKNVSQISDEKTTELIQRIKFLAGMNVLEKRRSQDGHFVYGNENPVFIRVSVMGIVGKDDKLSRESVVIRLLDTKRLPLALDKLGFTQKQNQKIQTITSEPNGLIIICGPTGAGKSTTAAAILIDIEKRRNSSVKIISIEDPPEYIIPGVTQIQVDEKIDNSFEDALTHVFRQDPDVLMIGEIRDKNSADVAIKAALTGHLVLATLHSSTAAGAILRLENIGISRNLIISVLKGVVVQELKTVGGNANLVADVSIPSEMINQAMDKNLVEEELERYFVHNTNYLEYVQKSLQVLKQKHTQIDDKKVLNKKAIAKKSGVSKSRGLPTISRKSMENAV